MAAFPGSIAFDEFGRPFIILRDQENQKRLTGVDALKVGYVKVLTFVRCFYFVLFPPFGPP